MLRLPFFSYLQPKSLAEALRMKSDAGPDGMFVAGGTDLYPNMKRRHQEPRVVISLMGIPELRTMEREKVGTCVTLSALSNIPSFQHSAVGTAAPPSLTIRAATSHFLVSGCGWANMMSSFHPTKRSICSPAFATLSRRVSPWRFPSSTP